MYTASLRRLGLLRTLREELAKLPAYVSYQAKKRATQQAATLSEAVEFIKGNNPHEDPALQERRRAHKALTQKILDEQAHKAQEERRRALARLSWRGKLQYYLREATQEMRAMVSTQAGVMALLQHCTAAHAAEVAMEQGIDVKDVQMVLEKRAAANAVGEETVVVGYIDAPAASEQEVMAFSARLQKACPMANQMSIEWRSGRPDAERGGAFEEGSSSSNSRGSASAGNPSAVDTEATNTRLPQGAKAQEAEGSIEMPAGMPGTQRWPAARKDAETPQQPDVRRDVDEDLHLPGIRRRRDPAVTPPSARGASATEERGEKDK